MIYYSETSKFVVYTKFNYIPSPNQQKKNKTKKIRPTHDEIYDETYDVIAVKLFQNV